MINDCFDSLTDLSSDINKDNNNNESSIKKINNNSTLKKLTNKYLK